MFQTLDDFDAKGKKIIIRADLNVPMHDGIISDNTRIDRLLPTINELRDKGAKVVIISHFGRPNGVKTPEMSLNPVTTALATALNADVVFIDDCIGDMAFDVIDAMENGEIILLENLRFHAGEEENSQDFAADLAKLGDIYVNDAFSCSHRAHASTDAIAKLLPAFAGRNMQSELTALETALGTPKHPVAAIVGGAKVSSKLSVLINLIDKVDMLVIGGGMANTFLHAIGTDIGNSLCEKNLTDDVLKVMAKADAANCQIILPSDAAVAKEFKADAAMEMRQIGSIPDDGMILDIGDDSINAICAKLEECKTIIWNGPVGAFEISPFDKGTVAIANKIAELTENKGLISIAGGGDTVAALNLAGVSDKLSYVSTAGGAFLEWMEGRELPGVKALEK